MTTLVGNISTRCSTPPQLTTKVVKKENLHHFMSTGATEKSLHLRPYGLFCFDEQMGTVLQNYNNTITVAIAKQRALCVCVALIYLHSRQD